MKIIYLFFLILFISCSETTTTEERIEKIVEKKNKTKPIISDKIMLDSILKSVTINNIDTFNIKSLQTDNFEGMVLIDEYLFKLIYPRRQDFSNNSFYIFSKIPNKADYYTLIIYQKNYEGEDYRVDYIELVNITKEGLYLEKIRLAVEDNETIIYEVNSILNGDLLIKNENISTFPETNSGIDTLHLTEYTFRLFGENRIDTIKLNKKIELIGK